MIALRRGSFHEYYVWNLAHLLPILLEGKYRIRSAHEQMAWIFAVEDGKAGAVNGIIVGSVVHQDDAGWGEDGCGAGFNHSRVETSGTGGEDGLVESLGPVDEVGGVSESDLAELGAADAVKIHPVFAIDLLRYDSSGLSPGFVPLAFVCGEDYTHALPVDQIFRGGQAKLGVFFVVAGVSEVVSAVKLDEARVFDSSIFFVVRFR